MASGAAEELCANAERYGTPNDIPRQGHASLQRLREGAHVVWLDASYPMYSKAAFKVEALIGLVWSTNNRTRMISVFRRV